MSSYDLSFMQVQLEERERERELEEREKEMETGEGGRAKPTLASLVIKTLILLD